METFSTLLAICARNSPVTGEFPAQRPVTRSFDVFFDLHLNKRVNNREAGDLRCHRALYDVIVMTAERCHTKHNVFIAWKTKTVVFWIQSLKENDEAFKKLDQFCTQKAR